MKDDTIDTKELRDRMMRLWRDTFHDSDEYIHLIFDNYFSPENVAYHCVDGKVVAALLAIPYDFVMEGRHLKSVYLCGLATYPEYRRQGIMRSLMEDICTRFQERGYTLAFLIPASEALIRYYRMAGWSPAIYRVKENYTEIHDFNTEVKGEKDHENVSVTRIEYSSGNVTPIENIKISNLISDFLRKYEMEKNYATLRHDPKTMDIVLQENYISNGEVWIARDKEKKLRGIAFVTLIDSPHPTVEIRLITADGKYIESHILSRIERAHFGIPLLVYRFPEEVDRKVIWQPYYGASDPEAPLAGAVGEAEKIYDVSHNAEVYGMGKILNPHEILKFVGVNPEDLEYSNLVKNPKELQAILFRRQDSKDLIGEVFHIPRLALNMALLLD